MNETMVRMPVSQRHPLCRTYHLASFASLSVQVRSGGSLAALPVHWALGTHVDDQLEVLGAWVELASGGLNWKAVFEELADRGVERIRVVVTADPIGAQAAYPHATFRTSDAPLRQDTAFPGAVPRRLRRVVARSEQFAKSMQIELARDVRRQRPLHSAQDALDFVGEALRRLERRTWMPTVVPRSTALRKRGGELSMPAAS